MCFMDQNDILVHVTYFLKIKSETCTIHAFIPVMFWKRRNKRTLFVELYMYKYVSLVSQYKDQNTYYTYITIVLNMNYG